MTIESRRIAGGCLENMITDENAVVFLFDELRVFAFRGETLPDSFKHSICSATSVLRMTLL